MNANKATVKRVVRVARLILSTRGRFFAVTFRKRHTGELRRMICRTGVKKYVTGEGMAYNPLGRGLIPVWSADSAGYRMIPTENVVSITFKGKEVRFQ